jgi:hypothetical protein
VHAAEKFWDPETRGEQPKPEKPVALTSWISNSVPSIIMILVVFDESKFPTTTNADFATLESGDPGKPGNRWKSSIDVIFDAKTEIDPFVVEMKITSPVVVEEIMPDSVKTAST